MRLPILFLLLFPPFVFALPWPAADTAGLAMAGAGAALSGDYRPRLNPASGALYNGRKDVILHAQGGPWAGRSRLQGRPSAEGRLLSAEAGLPRLPLSLGAYATARFYRIQGVESGRLRTREAWRIESGADVAGRWRDHAGRGRRLAWGVSPKVVTLRLRDGDDPAGVAQPGLRQTQGGRLDVDVGLLAEVAYRWRWALVGWDVLARGRDWPGGGGAAETGARWRGGVAYQGPRFSLALDMDLNAVHRGLGGRERRLAVGGQWRPWDDVVLRAGVAPDLLGNAPWRLGAGLSWQRGSVRLDGATQKEGPGRLLTVLGLSLAF